MQNKRWIIIKMDHTQNPESKYIRMRVIIIVIIEKKNYNVESWNRDKNLVFVLTWMNGEGEKKQKKDEKSHNKKSDFAVNQISEGEERKVDEVMKRKYVFILFNPLMMAFHILRLFYWLVKYNHNFFYH